MQLQIFIGSSEDGNCYRTVSGSVNQVADGFRRLCPRLIPEITTCLRASLQTQKAAYSRMVRGHVGGGPEVPACIVCALDLFNSRRAFESWRHAARPGAARWHPISTEVCRFSSVECLILS